MCANVITTSQLRPVRLAYVTRHVYPDPTAAAGQSIQMASALANLVGHAEFYVHNFNLPEDSVRTQYRGVADSPLHIRDLRMTHLNRWSRKLRLPRFIPYNSRVALDLLRHRMPRHLGLRRNVLFVRSRRESVYWGLLRRYMPWLRNWVFIFEAHDVAGMELETVSEQNPFDMPEGREGQRRRRIRSALTAFDVIICVTRALADDLQQWSNGTLQPHVVRHASGLQRLSHPPALRPFDDRVVLGYIGAIDQVRGVDKLITAMRWLPQRYILRLVGRIPGQLDNINRPVWLDELLNDPEIGPKVELVPPVPSNQVVEEIDRCDILLQPASDDVISLRYRSPLKLFDYLVRGKPIVIADVPCHRELVKDGIDAVLYDYDDPRHLASRIESLVSQPRRAQAIALAAWKKSATYDYKVRASAILELSDEAWARRNVELYA